MHFIAKVQRSSRPEKKFMVEIVSSYGHSRVVHFGAKGMSDYTLHKDKTRRANYVARHSKREDWASTGIFTPGFWSRWLLWNKPTLRASKNDISRHFNITFKS